VVGSADGGPLAFGAVCTADGTRIERGKMIRRGKIRFSPANNEITKWLSEHPLIGSYFLEFHAGGHRLLFPRFGRSRNSIAHKM
jgi:hypothetical protein